MESIVAWFSGLGAWGKVLFVLAYAGISMLPVPTAPFTLAGGALFGFAWGLAIIMIATMVGSTVAFLIARWGLRGPLKRLVERHKPLEAVARAVEDEGWKAVLLLQ